MKIRLWSSMLLVLISGCIRSPIALVASTKPLAPDGYAELGPVEETDCIWYLFGILPVTGGNNMQDAIADAIESRHGDALIQVTAETYFQYFIVVSRYCTIVQGIVVNSKQRPGSGPVPVAPLH